MFVVHGICWYDVYKKEGIAIVRDNSTRGLYKKDPIFQICIQMETYIGTRGKEKRMCSYIMSEEYKGYM